MMRHPTRGFGCWGRRCHHLRRSQYSERAILDPRCCRSIRISDLKPGPGGTGAVRHIYSFRDNTLKAKPSRSLKHLLAVAFCVLDALYPITATAKEFTQGRLTFGKRFAA
jgi:hypothetical protein